MTARNDADAPCGQRLEIHQELLNCVMDGILAHTLDGELLYANDAALRLWRSDFDTLKKGGLFSWVPLESRGLITERVTALIANESTIFRNDYLRDDGMPIHTEVHARLVDTTQGRIVIATIQDISERLAAEEMVRYLAYHDALTGLANRVLFEQELAHALSVADRYSDGLGILFVDLDAFKPVNDTYGHATGDEVLREVANRIAGCVRESDTVARFGGDEFVILLPRLARPEDLSAIAHKLSEEITRPIRAGAFTVHVRATFGLAVHDRAEDASSLMNRADLAMYEARETGMAGWELFARTV